MNAEQIRADAIECIARAEWDAWKASLKILDGEPADADYAEAPDDNVIKVALRQQATRDVDALAAAGLLPTSATYAVVHETFALGHDIPEVVYGHRENALAELDSWLGSGRVVGYLYTDWREVTG